VWNFIRQEPALVLGVVQAVIALAVSFGLGLSADQIGAILAVSAALLALATRSQVVPVVNVRGLPGEPPAQ